MKHLNECVCSVSLPALLYTLTTCCSISSLEVSAAKHHSTSLQSGVAAGCRRALSEALSGKILCLSVGLLHPSQKPCYSWRGERGNEHGGLKEIKRQMRHVRCHIIIIITTNAPHSFLWRNQSHTHIKSAVVLLTWSNTISGQCLIE